MPELAGAVMGGGRSSRMGKDKASLQVAGRSLTARLFEDLDALGCAPLAFSGSLAPDDLPVSVQKIPDQVTGQGPLSGLAALLEKLQKPMLVLACDMPGLDLEALQALRAAYRPGCGALLAEGPDGLHPLFGIYEPSVLPEIQERLKHGDGALYRLAEALHAAKFQVSNPRWLANVNTPEEAARWDLK
jgi:molybdopterin-guanine dinucleotide biosynthesis protein A